MRKLFGLTLVLFAVIALAVIPTAMGANPKSTPPLKVKTQITLQELVVPDGTALVLGEITNLGKSPLRFLSIGMQESTDGSEVGSGNWADIVGGTLPAMIHRLAAAITMLKPGKAMSFAFRVKVPPYDKLSGSSYWCLQASVFRQDRGPYTYSNRTCSAVVAAQPKKQ